MWADPGHGFVKGDRVTVAGGRSKTEVREKDGKTYTNLVVSGAAITYQEKRGTTPAPTSTPADELGTPPEDPWGSSEEAAW